MGDQEPPDLAARSRRPLVLEAGQIGRRLSRRRLPDHLGCALPDTGQVLEAPGADQGGEAVLIEFGDHGRRMPERLDLEAGFVLRFEQVRDPPERRHRLHRRSVQVRRTQTP